MDILSGRKQAQSAKEIEMAYTKTNILIYVTSELFPGYGEIYASEKFIATDETGMVYANS